MGTQEPTRLTDLYLVRHAFAEGPVDPPLSTHGRAQAYRLGVALCDLAVTFDKVVASPALRARQTWEGMSSSWSRRVEAEISGDAAPDKGAGLLPALLADAGRVLVITHEEVIAAIETELIGHQRSGYARASVTHLEHSFELGVWTTRYEPLDESLL